jgi:hypothetical protein
MRTARDGALALADELRAQRGTAARSLRQGVTGGEELARPGPAQIAAAGPRAAGLHADYELLIEMIHEGTLLHYGTPRVLSNEDRDLALLLGDQLYAMGLARLAELGDLEAVAELADLISLLAQVDAQPRAADRDALVAAIWDAGATAIGWGGSAEHEAAKMLVRAGDRRAVDALGLAGHRPR